MFSLDIRRDVILRFVPNIETERQRHKLIKLKVQKTESKLGVQWICNRKLSDSPAKVIRVRKTSKATQNTKQPREQILTKK